MAKNTLKKKRKTAVSTIAAVVIVIVGLAVAGYPIFADWWNTRGQAKVVSDYDKAVTKLDKKDYSAIFKKADDYNKRLLKNPSPFSTPEKTKGYEDTLDITNTGAMGYITIPQIDIQLPIYHGTSADILNVAVGHMEGSSLPVGGKSTHCVLSAHRGLPSAKLFSDLDKLVVGDRFTITVIDKLLTYEVEEINIVTPDKMEYLEVIPGCDYVTLMTCTPYGINTHRMLVRSRRVDNAKAPLKVNISADSIVIDPMVVFPVVLAPMLIVLIVYWIFGGRKKHFNAQRYVDDITKKGGL